MIAAFRRDSALDPDGESYDRVAAVPRAVAEFLPTLSSHLLMYGTFPVTWKVAKCVPILKPGHTDESITKNL